MHAIALFPAKDAQVHAMRTPPCYVASMHSPAWDRAQLRRALRQLLKETGLSPQDLADMAGVSRPQVSRWMSGENRPGFDAASRLARALGRDHPAQRDLVTDFITAAGYPEGQLAHGEPAGPGARPPHVQAEIDQGIQAIWDLPSSRDVPWGWSDDDKRAMIAQALGRRAMREAREREQRHERDSA